MTRPLRSEGYEVLGRKCVRRLMRLMGLEAIYQKPNRSRPNAAHKTQSGDSASTSAS